MQINRKFDDLKRCSNDPGEVQAAETSLAYWMARFKEVAVIERQVEYFKQTAITTAAGREEQRNGNARVLLYFLGLLEKYGDGGGRRSRRRY